MTKPIIEIENISKCYRIGAHKEPYLSLRDEVARTARRITASLSRLTSRQRTTDQGQSETDFWALKDVSFSVKEGEAVGIIGRNGAGKSTLLKILSQITPPTEGKITMRGRVASLLEVGTGFHPELTGRENIFLNGTILGMTRAEVKRKFDEIVAFSEVEKFLDTPVKRYSSGMYVRLAFAVAAHLEPEILVVDEVLAVGDVEFQKKCLGKMGEVANSGRTVLFVSHNMAAVQQLCTKGILLKLGRVECAGKIQDVINNYTNAVSSKGVTDLTCVPRKSAYPQSFSKIVSCQILNDANTPCNDFFMGDNIKFKICVKILRPMKRIEVGIGIRSNMNVPVHYLSSSWAGHLYDLSCGYHVFLGKMPNIRLLPGRFLINCYVTHDSKSNYSDDCVFDIDTFHVYEKDITKNFAKLELNNTFSRYAKSGSEVFVESEWNYLGEKNNA